MGRFGNWFNQELFGRPTDLPWGLEIDLGAPSAGLRAVRDLPPDLPLRVALVRRRRAASWCGPTGAGPMGHGRAFALYVDALHDRPRRSSRACASTRRTTSSASGSTSSPRSSWRSGRSPTSCQRPAAPRPRGAGDPAAAGGRTPVLVRRAIPSTRERKPTPGRPPPRRHGRLAAPGRLRRDGRSRLQLRPHGRRRRWYGGGRRRSCGGRPRRSRRSRRRRVLDGRGGVHLGRLAVRARRAGVRERAARARRATPRARPRSWPRSGCAAASTSSSPRRSRASSAATPRPRSRCTRARSSGSPRASCPTRGSPPGSSFLAFAIGALIPLLPYLFGAQTLVVSAVLVGHRPVRGRRPRLAGHRPVLVLLRLPAARSSASSRPS